MTKKWTKAEISEIYHSPILELIFKAASLHREYHDSREIQVCSLISLKTGGCSEDCSYCSQSSHFETGVEKEKMLEIETVMQAAKKAKNSGSTRFCMGTVGRKIKDVAGFDKILEIVGDVNEMGLEVCCSLGMLTYEQAQKLKDAGLHTYNHNLDTGEKYYSKVVTTHTYQDRMETIKNVSKADLSLCCGGILGLGESEEDRIDLLATLSNMAVPPESVPVNILVPVPGTPLEKQPKIPVWEAVRMIATARILMPDTMVRLSAGRTELSTEEQALCFLAGANSIFSGEKLLTTPNVKWEQDGKMFQLLDLVPRKPFKHGEKRQSLPRGSKTV